MTREIVGRDTELGRLGRFVADVSVPPASALVLDGEAGSGKTTLLAAATEEAAGRGYRILSTQGAESEATLSFAAVGDLLGPVVDDVLPALPAPQQRALEVALLLRPPRGRSPQRRAVAVAFLGALRVLASASPVLVTVDDVQWLDAASASTIEFAVRRLDREPVGVLVARRTARPAPVPLGLDRALREERVGRLDVGLLSLGAVHHLLHRRLGVAFSRPTLRRLHETSRGNPLFALELGRALLAAGGDVDVRGALPVPAELRTLVRERVQALPADTRAALLAAAAVRDATVHVVEAAAGGDLRPAVEAQIVEIDAGRVRFAHPLFASGVYAGAEPAERRRAHRRLSLAVPEREEQVRHLALATEAPDEEVAAALDEAARLALARGAPAEAAELADEARRLTPADCAQRMHARAVEAAAYRFEAGDAAGARAVLEEVVRGVPGGRVRALALARLARVRSFDDDLRAAVDLFEESLADAAGDPGVQQEAHDGLAWTLLRLREDLAAAERHARKALDLARSLGDAAQEAHSLAGLANIQTFRGREAGARTMREALVRQRHAEGLRITSQPRFTEAVRASLTDQIEEARRSFEDLLDRAWEIGDESSVPYLMALASGVDCLLGEFSTAARKAADGHAIALQAGQKAQEAYFLATTALVDAHRGRAHAVRAAASASMPVARETGAVYAVMTCAWALGLLELSLGDVHAADRELSPIVAWSERAGVAEPGAVRFVPVAVEALVALGRHDEAERHLAPYERNAVRLDRPSALAASRRCRALLASVGGDHDAALHHLDRALVDHARVPMPFERARTLLVLGTQLRRIRRRRAARETLEEALGTFDRVGAEIWAANARRELARIGGRTPSGDDLTGSEERVAALVAEGRTNREVAAALFVTERTVESHLSRIYAKLGVRSRTELARRQTSPGDGAMSVDSHVSD